MSLSDFGLYFWCMVKNTLMLLMFVAFYNSAIAQQSISGKVVDADKKGIPYVNIGIKGGKNGTVSTTNGDFVLNVNDELLKDSVTFSSIGFKEQRFLIKDLIANHKLIITLTEKIAVLNEVRVTNAKRKMRKLGITGRTPMVSIPTSSLQSSDVFEQARLIHLKSPAKIINANIFIISNDQREVNIRVNFYAFKNGLPAERLIEKSIIKKTKVNKGWLSIDLSADDIYIDDDFVVSFEYLPEEKKDYKRIVFGAKLGASDSWIRNSSLGIWRKNELGGATIYVTAEM
ncbi:MAG: hypothetical protein EOO47_09825 [Flavobacterium sp.]|nr:MAG: hypothetical protein EOO47_09825 [Flavobacterium sp.]